MKAADVAVIGAGPSGIAAAVASARAGSRTLLLDAAPFAGGTPVKGHMTTLCGLYPGGSGSNHPKMLYDGIVREFADLLMHLDGISGPVRLGKAWVLLFRPQSFAAAAYRLIENESRLTVCFGARLCDAEVSGRRIRSIECRVNGREERIRIGAAVDASGNAELCRTADAPLLSPDETRQVPAISFPVYRVQTGQITSVKAARWHMRVRRAAEDGDLPGPAADVSFLAAPDPGTLVVKLNLGAFLKAEPHVSEAALLEKANETRDALIRFFRQCIPEFASCRIPGESSPVLHREGYRVRGQYVLTRQDVLGGAEFEDAAARGCWPVELWDENGNFFVQYSDAGQYYEIPARSLRSAEIENLFMAGKSISADSAAIASARVIGCCLATGEAAGRLTSESLS